MDILFDTELIEIMVNSRIAVIESVIKCMPSPVELNELIDRTIKTIHSGYKLEEINRLENIHEARKAYKKFGNDPNRYRPSAESLMRRIVKGYGLYRINNVVDTLNLISLKSGISIGGYDANKIKGNVFMSKGKAGELNVGIGRGVLNICCLPVLRDDIGAFGTPTSDSERTMITETTEQIVFVFFDFACAPNINEFLTYCELLLRRYSYADNITTRFILPGSDPIISGY